MRPRELTSIVAVALLALAVAGCKEKRQRRPRTAPAAAREEPKPPPPPAPKPVAIPLPPPPPPAPAPKPVDRSRCGPSGNGPRFSVHGVEPSDTLNVRAEPDPQADVVGQLPPSTTGVVAVGGEQRVGPSTWRKVRCGDVIGWVNGRFLDRM